VADGLLRDKKVAMAKLVTGERKKDAPRVHFFPPDEILFGKSEAMLSVRLRARQVSNSDLPVLICGEAGTGKSTLAYWIHRESPRRDNSFVTISCAALPGSLLESELFGYSQGAFTGALVDKPGRVEQADGGTLLLEGVENLDPSLQAKLLQFLQDGTFMRLGDPFERRINARVICTAQASLDRQADEGKFRPDLLYRINVIEIKLPTLPARKEDVSELADHFLVQQNQKFGRNVPKLSQGLKRYLENREWRGNIRELENRITRYVILGAEDALQEGDSEPASGWNQRKWKNGPYAGMPLRKLTKEVIRGKERDLILQALRENRWNRRAAAKVLNISYRALIYKINEAGLATRKRSVRGMPPNTEEQTEASSR